LGKYPTFPPTDPGFEDPPRLSNYDAIVIGGGGGGYHGAFDLVRVVIRFCLLMIRVILAVTAYTRVVYPLNPYQLLST